MSTIKTETLSTPSNATVPVDTVVNGTAKAWVNFNGTGTVAIRRAFNVSSITDNGTGNYTVNFTTAMPDASYCVSQYLADTYQRGGYNPTYSTSSFQFNNFNDSNGAAADDLNCNIAIFS